MSSHPPIDRAVDRVARRPDPDLARLLETEARLRRSLAEREMEADRLVEAARDAAEERERGAEEELARAESDLRARLRNETERERREIRERALCLIRRYRQASRQRLAELARWVASRVLGASAEAGRPELPPRARRMRETDP